jgi:hypothetical protein
VIFTILSELKPQLIEYIKIRCLFAYPSYLEGYKRPKLDFLIILSKETGTARHTFFIMSRARGTHFESDSFIEK